MKNLSLLAPLSMILLLTVGAASATEGKRLSFRVRDAVGMESYTLSGSGFTASVPLNSGNTLGGSARYHLSSVPIQFRLGFESGSTGFSGLTGLTPSGVTLKKLRGHGAVLYAPFADSSSKWIQPMMFGASYTWLNRKAGLTTPNAIFTEETLHGFGLQFSTGVQLATDWGIDLDLDFSLPGYFSETLSRTGFYSGAMLAGAELTGRYDITENLQLALGAVIRIENTRFSGTGTRNTTDARESFFSLSIPVEVRLNFLE